MAGIKGYVVPFALLPPVNTWQCKNPQVVRATLDASGYDGTAEQAGTVCDLTSYTVLRIALGSDRVKTLEKQKISKGWNNDETFLYRFKASNAFSVFMNAWTARKKPGVVQFKFFPQSGAHTFAAERIWQRGAQQPYFQVYQAYQGCYRLSDQLGITDIGKMLEPRIVEEVKKSFEQMRDNPVGLKFVFGKKPNDLLPKISARWDSHEAKIRKELTKQVGGVVGMSRILCNPLSDKDFTQLVLEPLSKMLGNGASAAEYAQLTGHPTNGAQQCATMLTLGGDFDEDDAFANALSLNRADDVSPNFVEIDV